MTNYILKPLDGKNLNIDFNKELNPEQLEVVFNGDGPCLVLAGAGSGKTRTLVYRVVYLLSCGVPAENIMLLTFTNKAAREMLERVGLYLGAEAKGLWGGTFHSTGNRLLRMYGERIGIGNNFTILDEEDSITLLKNSISQANPPSDKYFPKARVIKSLISLSANLCRSLDEVIDLKYDAFKPEYRPCLNQAAEIYRQRKMATNSLDFDDLLVKWKDLLENDANLRSALGRKFKYILVDEYQDTNYLQSRIINNLAEPQNNVLVVGDDSQSIYGFRGADVNNILDFPEVFKNTKVFHLDTNYRSTPEILELANLSIKKNQKKFDKKLSAVCASGRKPALVSATDNYQQAEFVASRILDLQQEENYNLNDIAVLFRSHFQSLELEMELNKRGIPYQMRGGVRFFEQAHLKDVIAYLKVINNFQDEVAWLRLLGMQAGIGSVTAEKICRQIFSFKNLSSAIKTEIKLGSKALVGWQGLKRTLEKLVELPPDDLSGLLKVILSGGYEKYLQANFDNYRERLEDLEQLIIFAASYDSLEQFLADTALSENFRGQDRENSDTNQKREQLVLSTIHQAKGLEWRAVFIIGLADGLFPHARTYDNSGELEEERRLFYVAVTRAKEQLYLTYPLFSRDNLLQSSPFIKELPPNLYEHWDSENESDDVDEEVVYVDEDGEPCHQKTGTERKKLLDFDCSLEIEELDF
jgi:DNA helicase II / ATP-dependent DNA helicase PcrA